MNIHIYEEIADLLAEVKSKKEGRLDLLHPEEAKKYVNRFRELLENTRSDRVWISLAYRGSRNGERKGTLMRPGVIKYVKVCENGWVEIKIDPPSHPQIKGWIRDINQILPDGHQGKEQG